MKILHYRAEYKPDCIAIFMGNVDKFFDRGEVQAFEQFLDRHASEIPYFVLRDRGVTLACGGYVVHEGKASLSWGMVRREVQGRGIGSFLLRLRLRSLHRRWGSLPLTLDTSQVTQAFYARHGFVPVNLERDAYGAGLDKIVMQYQGDYFARPPQPQRETRGR